jgi:hypothetical protein
MTYVFESCPVLKSTLKGWEVLLSGGSGMHPRGGCRATAPSQTQQNWNLKNTDFMDIMISNVLCDLPSSWNQPLKSAHD